MYIWWWYIYIFMNFNVSDKKTILYIEHAYGLLMYFVGS